MTFANFFSDRRKQLGLSMRKFAIAKGYDVGYLSRLEAGIISAPAEQEKVEALAKAVDIKSNTTQWVEFFDLAAASRAELPNDLKDNQAVLNMLPAFYRTLRKDKISEREITRLIQQLKGDDYGSVQKNQISPSLHDRGGA